MTKAFINNTTCSYFLGSCWKKTIHHGPSNDGYHCRSISRFFFVIPTTRRDVGIYRQISSTSSRWSQEQEQQQHPTDPSSSSPCRKQQQPNLLQSWQNETAAKRAAEHRLTLLGVRHQDRTEQFKVTQVVYNSGQTSTINLPPAEILKRTSILPRDLVSLNLQSRDESSHKRRLARPPTAILPRTDCILLSFGNVRAVAGRDSVFILDAHSPIANSFAKDLAAVYMTGAIDESPELVFLEAVLRDTVDTYNRRIRIFEPIVDDFLDRASNEVFSDAGVYQLVPLKDSLQSFELQVKQSLECLTSLLNDDDLMLNLLLIEQAEARQKAEQVDFARHEHVELMLSVYSRQIHNLLQEIQYLLGRLQSKQEFIALALAGYRNRLVRMNVNLGIVGVSTGVTTATTGLFGMNLINGFEQSQYAFVMVTSGSATVAVMVAHAYFSFIRGQNMQQRAQERLAEIETFVSALSDMGALDYTLKRLMNGTGRMNKDTFKKLLVDARSSKQASDEEIDLLFRVLDTNKDNELTWRDFYH